MTPTRQRSSESESERAPSGPPDPTTPNNSLFCLFLLPSLALSGALKKHLQSVLHYPSA